MGLDGRKSIILGENTEIGGLKIGAILNKKYKMGLGFYWMKNDIVRTGNPGARFQDATNHLFYSFSYLSLFYERIWHYSKRWQISSPIHLGSASIRADYLNTSNKRKSFLRKNAPLLEVSGVAQYKFFRWLAVGTGLGTRVILIDDKKTKKALNGPVYILQLKILFGVLWKLYHGQAIDDDWN